MQNYEIKSFLIKNLLLNIENYRFEPVSNQREALSTIAHDQGLKLVAIAEDILDRGTNPSDLPIVTPADGKELFRVLEGNRRVAALKILSSAGLAGSLGLTNSIVKRWKALEDQVDGTIPETLTCVVMAEEDAKEWIRLKHTGENEGIGTVTWDGLAKHRFRGDSSALQAIDMVNQKGYLDQDTKDKLPKIHITNIERMLVTRDARKLLGVDVQGGQLIIVATEEEALGRLALLVMDIAHRRKKVTDLDDKEQRVDYAKELAARELPLPNSPGGNSGQPGGADKTGEKSKGKQTADRNTLIPKKLKLSISQSRINQIYDELQKLDIGKFTNSAAVLFRVFVELSIDEFASRNSIVMKAVPKPSPGKTAPPISRVPDMNLRNKILTVAKYLEDNSICDKHKLLGIRSLAKNTDHVLSVNTLNAYVHNQHYNPTSTELKANWDSIQAFISAIWT